VRDDDGRIIAGMGSPRMGPELHRAITEDEFVVYGQPVIHLATGHRQRWNA
jgi:sensor c-di-GMP phosphodiesterase-like protein